MKTVTPRAETPQRDGGIFSISMAGMGASAVIPKIMDRESDIVVLLVPMAHWISKRCGVTAVLQYRAVVDGAYFVKG
jgi:hypothetical protein